jgi:predicted RNase H-like HicB family nuclease
MYDYQYPVTLTPDEGGFIVTFNDPAGRFQGVDWAQSEDAALLAASGLLDAMIEEGINKAELARRLGWKHPQVSRLFDVSHTSKLDQLAASAQALGRRFVIGIEQA